MFQALDENNAVAYVLKSPLMDGIFQGVDDLEAKDLAEGNINLIFRVKSKSDPLGKSVILKQALPYAHRYPDFKMPQHRARLEAEMLGLENKYCPGLAPRTYYYDEEQFINALEDLNHHIIMRNGLMKQVCYPNFAGHIGTFLARMLFYTSDLYLDSAEKKAMMAHYSNPVMCKVTEDLVFTEPFVGSQNNHWTPQLTPQVAQIQANQELREKVFTLKDAFMNQAQALIHGDLHTGSIMVNETETKVLDPEFGFFGPAAFDIGAVLGNLILSYGSQEYHAKDEALRSAYRRWLLDTICAIWHVIENEMRSLWETKSNGAWPSDRYRDWYLLRLLRDSAGFSAAKAMRRIIGMAHVPDMWEIPDDPTRAVAESIALNAAQAWLLNRDSVTTIEELVEMVAEAQPGPLDD